MAKRPKKAKPENSESTARNTAGLRPWQPGQSGNPGGRPKVIGELRDLARIHTLEALETLTEIMKDKGAPPAARVAAVSHILDRGYGKPTQTISATVQNIRQMTDDELLSFITGTDEAGGGEGDFAPAHDPGQLN